MISYLTGIMNREPLNLNVDTTKWKKIGRGAGAEVYDIGDGAVVKVFSRKTVKLESIRQELKNQKFALDNGLAVPRCWSNIYKDNNNNLYIKMQKINGSSLVINEKLTDDELEYVISGMVSLQHKIYSVKVRKNIFGIYEISKNLNKALKQNIQKSISLNEEVKSALLARMDKLEREKTTTKDRLCHMDMSPENILYDKNEDKFWCIDWQGVVFGDFIYGVAKTYCWFLLNRPGKAKDMFIKKVHEIMNIEPSQVYARLPIIATMYLKRNHPRLNISDSLSGNTMLDFIVDWVADCGKTPTEILLHKHIIRDFYI